MKRPDLQHFVDISMNGAEPDYHLLGEGIDSLSEEFNPEEETEQWINQYNGTTDIKSYTPSISVEMQDVDQDDTELMDWIYHLVDTLPTGKDAVTNYLRVRVKGNGPTYPAVKRNCSVSVSSTGGDAGANIVNSITIGGRGDGVAGTYNAETGKFTEGSASPAMFSADADGSLS